MNATEKTHLTETQEVAPRVIAWESTRACNFACVHCRAEAQKEPDPKQLTTQEALNLIDQIAELCKPVFIISGGDPLSEKRHLRNCLIRFQFRFKSCHVSKRQQLDGGHV